jgi:hypothetical protein
MNGDTIPFSTFSLSLWNLIAAATAAAAGPASGSHFFLRNSDISAPSFFLHLPGRLDHSPCIHILYQASSLTSIALPLIKYSISAAFFLY